MKTTAAGLLTFMQTYNLAAIAEIYTITLNDGTVLYYTTADSNIIYGGNTFLSSSVKIVRGSISEKCGTQVSELKMMIYPQAATIYGLGFVSACAKSALDYAEVKLQRLYYDSFGGTLKGALTMFDGLIVNDIGMARDHVDITVSSFSYLLGINWPVNVYEDTCIWQLYGSGCGLVKASWTVTGAVVADAGNTTSLFKTNLTQADAYFTKGVIKFTSGSNANAIGTVKQFTHTNGLVQMIIPLQSIPAGADAFSIYPGCDHQRSTCKQKFNNNDANGNLRFRGFPFIPTPETAT